MGDTLQNPPESVSDPPVMTSASGCPIDSEIVRLPPADRPPPQSIEFHVRSSAPPDWAKVSLPYAPSTHAAAIQAAPGRLRLRWVESDIGRLLLVTRGKTSVDAARRRLAVLFGREVQPANL